MTGARSDGKELCDASSQHCPATGHKMLAIGQVIFFAMPVSWPHAQLKELDVKRSLKRMLFDSARLLRTDEGASAAEYGILAALIAFAVLAAVYLLSNRLSQVFAHGLDKI